MGPKLSTPLDHPLAGKARRIASQREPAARHLRSLAPYPPFPLGARGSSAPLWLISGSGPPREGPIIGAIPGHPPQALAGPGKGDDVDIESRCHARITTVMGDD